MKSSKHDPQSGGFALVVTLALMILLTIIAVGLLSLSAISLRASGQNQSMAIARSNARLALMLAIGDLQKSLGPDRAVSASGEFLGATPTKSHTVGAWESWWDFNPANSSIDYTSEKRKRFRRWLVSYAYPSATASPNFAAAKWSGPTIQLVGNNTLGRKVDASAKIFAGRVPVASLANGKADGAYAWHVADESAKARLNLYRDPDQNTTVAQQRALLAGQRPDPSVISDADGVLLDCLPTDQDSTAFQKAVKTGPKLTDLDQTELLDQARGRIKPLRHDVTTCSLGVLANVRDGGLKQDLSSVFEMSDANNVRLPGAFTGKRLYASTPATPGSTSPILANGVSDPYWSTLAGYYNLFRGITAPDSAPAYAVPAKAANNDAVPTNFYPVPVIAKVETIFSLIVRPVSDVYWFDTRPVPPGQNGALSDYDCFVDLIFTPLVTLHNPYNVNLSFYRINVTFVNVPIAFQFFRRSGDPPAPMISQSVDPGPEPEHHPFESLNGMTGTGDKTFVINIANWSDTQSLTSSAGIAGPIVMQPGQTMICAPCLPPNSSFKNDAAADKAAVAFDWLNKVTQTIKAKPMYTSGLGYETDGVAISHLLNPVTRLVEPNGWNTFLFLRNRPAPPPNSGEIKEHAWVEFKAQQPSWPDQTKTTTLLPDKVANPSFTVTADLQPTAGDKATTYAKLEFDYSDDKTLKNFFNNRAYRYPDDDIGLVVADAAPGGTTYAEQGSYVHPFAIFSAYARTTNGGVYETGSRGPTTGALNVLKDGRLAGKPFLFHNPSRPNFTMDLSTAKPGVQSHELNLQPLDSSALQNMQVSGNRVPALTGYGNPPGRGIKSGSYFELPTGPMQTIADFRRSNALTTSFLPGFVQPVGNSLVSALMSTDKVTQTDKDISPDDLLDHSVLANHALYDRYYFSTFATRGNESPAQVFEKFMNGTAPLASQAFLPHRSGGKSVAAAKSELFNGARPNDGAYQKAAEYQMIQGPFNINSTSTQAWKAVLASMNKSNVVTLWPNSDSIESKKATGVPILGMSLLNGGATNAALDAGKIDDAKTNEWNGYHELTDSQLGSLASNIVSQVRSRGPFLSMSEFVNRQIGANGPLTRRGALEAAIDGAGLNNNFFKNNETNIGLNDINDPKTYKYNTPEVVTGNPVAGAPGWINQGDLLRILEPAATVRGDTFVIRVCGEAWDPAGKVAARAYAEAVVQRMPEYVNPADRPSVNAYTNSKAAKANKNFGRRFNLVSFRWLSGKEI